MHDGKRREKGRKEEEKEGRKEMRSRDKANVGKY